MKYLLSILLLFAYIIISNRILNGEYENRRILSISEIDDEYYEMNPLMFYLIFVVVTAPFFLVPPFALIKYAVYFIFLLILLKDGQITIPTSWIQRTYWLFYAWLIICAVRSQHLREAFTLLVKYLLPVLSLYLGYSALKNKYDIYYFMRFVLLAVLAYTFLIGGLAAKYYSWLYFSPIGDQFLRYAGYADYQSALFILPFVMTWISGNKKWLFIAIAMLLSTILDAVRTGLGGMCIVAIIYALFRYKLSSLPIIGIIGVSMLAAVLYIPEINDKFFFDDGGEITAEDILYEDAMAFENINSSGREFMWELVMDKCYYGHEMLGSGLGHAGAYLVYLKNTDIHFSNIAEIIHSDYVQILCDTGLIGLGLFIVFSLTLIISITKRIWFTDDLYLKITGIITIASFCGTAFSMGFDNVVSHSMTSLIIPFIFAGMYLKTLELTQYDEISE